MHVLSGLRRIWRVEGKSVGAEATDVKTERTVGTPKPVPGLADHLYFFYPGNGHKILLDPQKGLR